MSTIEWTDETWNPTVGCSRVSPGCDGCYAIRVAAREMQPAHVGLTTKVKIVPEGKPNAGASQHGLDWTGEVRLLPDRLDTPLRWRKPRRVFVDSMSDLFHPDVPDSFIVAVWSTMMLAREHTFQVLTKRPQRMASFVGADGGRWLERMTGAAAAHQSSREHVESIGWQWPLPNVWLGTSVENQRYADLRIPHLVATPAAVRFLSIEPLLGPVDLMGAVEPDWIGSSAGGSGAPHPLVDWVIVGGESGPGARPMHPDWVRSIRDQCVAAGVPFFFKQWGEWVPSGQCDTTPSRRAELWDAEGTASLAAINRVGKKLAGRELDGRTWNEMPDHEGAVRAQ